MVARWILSGDHPPWWEAHSPLSADHRQQRPKIPVPAYSFPLLATEALLVLAVLQTLGSEAYQQMLGTEVLENERVEGHWRKRALEEEAVGVVVVVVSVEVVEDEQVEH